MPDDLIDMSKGRILIAGAGVAGLSAALELAARGWNVRLVEKAETLSEVGAGLQLAPNAMRHLERLGVAAVFLHKPYAGSALPHGWAQSASADGNDWRQGFA
ncbi:FAD-dependent oxidoreductase, partial [Klebsiella pneumoniae subsp. pneumoniae]